jgi:pyruvate ferredoxin oxidoreductase beta subunit
MWMLYEVENGVVQPTVKIKERKPVAEYLKAQSRFSRLSQSDIDQIQQFVDNKCKEFGM